VRPPQNTLTALLALFEPQLDTGRDGTSNDSSPETPRETGLTVNWTPVEPQQPHGVTPNVLSFESFSKFSETASLSNSSYSCTPDKSIVFSSVYSSSDDVHLFEILDTEVKEVDPREAPVLPLSTLVVVSDPEKVSEQLDQSIEHEFDFECDGTFKCSNWGGKRFYSDYIKAGIEYKKKLDPSFDPKVVMLFESPLSSMSEHAFHNKEKFRFHDWPLPKHTKPKVSLGRTDMLA
jgi:hypothetical protein